MKLASLTGIALAVALVLVAQSKTGKQPSAPAAKSAKSAKTSAKKAVSQPPARYRRTAQLQPSQQRYREIQQALADKGHFEGPVDGRWGPDSIEALKRFQREQHLVEDGKIGSLSLIALGLGSPHGVLPSATREPKP